MIWLLPSFQEGERGGGEGWDGEGRRRGMVRGGGEGWARGGDGWRRGGGEG